MEWFVTILVVAPALFLAFTGSSWLLDYTIVVLAFNRGLRRIIDYYFNGQFNPFSPISLTPLFVAGLLIIPAIVHRDRLTRSAKTVFLRLGVALFYGLGIGLVRNHLAAVYHSAEWISSIAAMAFAATQPAGTRVADRWIRTAGWTALGVAVYGWWQYFTIPPWDAMWLVQSGMAGYMGQPEPTQMTLFSTMNERGPCGTLLAWAVIPMLIVKQWRNFGGWISIAFLVATIFLTGTRSNFVLIGFAALAFPAITKGKGILTVAALSLLLFLGINYGIDKIPGAERFVERYEAGALYGEGSSWQGRLGIYGNTLQAILHNPLGLGLGSSGMAHKAVKSEIETTGESGYLQMFSQFGWLGGLFFYAAFWALWKELRRRWKLGCTWFTYSRVDKYLPTTQVVLLSSFVFLFVGDIFSGFSLMWVFFGRSLSREADPLPRVRLLAARREAKRLVTEAPKTQSPTVAVPERTA